MNPQEKIMQAMNSQIMQALKAKQFDQALELIKEGESFPSDLPDHMLDQSYQQMISERAFPLLHALVEKGIINTDLYEYTSFDKSIFRMLFYYLPTDQASLEFFESFVQKFDNLNEEVKGQSLLSYALETGVKPELIEGLIRAGCDIHYRNNAQETLLFQVSNSTLRNQEYLVQYLNTLIENGLDVNEVNVVRQTPLHAAVVRNQKEVIDVLLEHGAQPNEQDDKGDTLFHYALSQRQNLDLYTKLSTYASPDFNLLNKQGESVLLGFLSGSINSLPNKEEILERLIDDGADIQQTASWYSVEKSALDWIVEKPESLLKTVLDKGIISINDQDEEGNTLLHKVCRIDPNYDQNVAKEIYKKVKLLLSSGADPGIQNDKDETPMMLASEDNLKTKTVELLLQHK